MFSNIWAATALSIFMFGAFSSSSSYQLQNYGIGSGGTNSASSPQYNLNGSTGETSGTSAANAVGASKSGSRETQQANVPTAPTLSDGGGTYYNKLLATINTSGSDASDYTYSIAVSNNGFSSTSYVQADGTLGASALYQSLATWGGTSGSFITGLAAGTTYQVKVNAKQGTFTASAYGPAATATTANPSLSFSMSTNNLALGVLTAGNVITGSNVALGFATNATAGGSIYVAGANSGLKSVNASYTISSATAALNLTNEGFGISARSPSQTSGGPFAPVSPFNTTNNSIGGETTTYQQLLTSPAPIVGATATGLIKAKAAITTPSATDYSETLTFVAAANY